MRSSWDAVVIGAGPAGAATAMELARSGASVLLVERTPFPRWKVCGSCLGPGTQEVLRSLGMGDLLAALGAPTLRTLRVAGWGVTADIPLLSPVAVSRAALDAALVEAAVGAGVTLLAPGRARVEGCEDGARLLALEVAGDHMVIRAKVVVAADGLGSPALSRARALDTGPGGEGVGIWQVSPFARVGFGALFPADTPGFEGGVIHMAVGPTGYVGAVRLEDGTLDVAAALSLPAGDEAGTRGDVGSRIRPEDAVSRILDGAGFPPLAPKPLAGWRGTPRLTRTVRSRGAERLFAVGDAAGYVEPFTGEGIGWALAGARTLTPIALEGILAWEGGLVAAWDRAYVATVGAQARLCRGLAWGLRHPWLSQAGIHLLRSVPSMARPVVRWAGRAAVHDKGRAV